MFDKRSIQKRLEGRFIHEENFIKVLDQIDRAFKSYQLVITDFISPGMVSELKPFIEMERDFSVSVFGGYDDAERVRMAVFPDYMEVECDDFDICLLKGKFPVKFESIEHRDILGSLMSQGFRREKLGDIAVLHGEFYIFCSHDVKDYLRVNLERIKRIKVSLEEVPLETFKSPERAFKETSGTVSSLRLDAILSQAYGISRTKAAAAIKGELVKVNHKVIDSVSYELSQGDLLSLRGSGRMLLSQVGGKTKKDRLRVVFKKYL